LPNDWAFVVASSGMAAPRRARPGPYNRSLSPQRRFSICGTVGETADATLLAAQPAHPTPQERIRNLLGVLPVEGFHREFLVGRFEHSSKSPR